MTPSRIEDELRIRRQIAPESRAHLNLLRTADHVSTRFSALLKEHGLTESQYNVLRILRGAGPEGLPCRAIGGRMITRLPDITRLLDRLEAAGLVRRERSAHDRRIVLTRIEPRGEELVDALDEPVRQLEQAQYRHMTRDELEELSRLLEKVRLGGPPPKAKHETNDNETDE